MVRAQSMSYGGDSHEDDDIQCKHFANNGFLQFSLLSWGKMLFPLFNK